MEPDLFCFDSYHVETQHLAWEGLVHDSGNDLLPIRGDLTIVDLAIVPVGDPDDNRCTGCHGDGGLEVLQIGRDTSELQSQEPSRMPSSA